MKIISLEGLDKSGKYTAAKLLTDRLRVLGYKVEQSEFHNYSSPTGQLIMQWLTKEWDVDQKTIELVMAADKQSQQQWFAQLEKDGIDFLILDRYVGSQFVYATQNGITPQWARELQRYMRKPDFQILIDIPANVSMERKGKHNNGENDRYESDRQMLERVREGYLGYIDAWRPKADMVNGLQSIDEVHEDIWKIVQRLL